MVRTGLLQFLLAMAALLPAPVLHGQSGTVYRVGGIAPQSPEGLAQSASFRDAMRELGYVEGRNIAYLTHASRSGADARAASIEELIAQKPHVLIGWESDARAMRAKTTTIPIVLTGGLDPVGARLAQSIRRPGMNVTGVAQLNDVLTQKHVELLSEILPQARRIGLLFDKSATGCVQVERSAREATAKLGKALVVYEVGNRDEIVRAFGKMESDRPDALLPCPSVVTYNQRELLFREGLRLRIPWTSFIVDSVPDGVLVAYSSSRHEEMRKAAVYVDKILKGADPAVLPIEQPTRFELVLNLRTAKMLDLKVPSSVMLRADRVVE
jgi:putative ABC transport system substrate-binding protein